MVEKTKIGIDMATIAVLTAPSQLLSISQQELEQHLTPPLTIGQSQEGLLVSSQKDQIQVLAGGIKLNVRDLSGRKTFTRSKIPKILHYFIKTFGLQVNSYGVNFVINLPCEQSDKWISDNILSTQVFKKTGKKLVGGAATVKLVSEQKIWNVKFETYSDKKIKVDFNASQNIQQLPNEKTLKIELQEQFNDLLKFLGSMELL